MSQNELDTSGITHPITMTEIQRNPVDSMKSTWRQSPRSEWTTFHYVFDMLGIHQSSLDKQPPAHSKHEKVPHLPNWHLTRWVLLYAFIPIALHHAYVYYSGRNMHVIAAYFFYNISMTMTAVHALRIFCRMGLTYGFLDGDKHARDGVPDVGVRKVFYSIASVNIFRSMLVIILAYRSGQKPSDMNWTWLPLEIGIYPVILDFWFYWYHRLMHEIDGLWQFHRTHHLTKHPNALLALYADTEQEIFDIVASPLLAFATMKAMGMPMGFYELWVCHAFILFTEIFGHSGLRLHMSPPSTIIWLLNILNAELIVEDHDLHHRSGWKKSYNYGKQTRVWDRVFGTCAPRIECQSDNIDYVNTATLPLI
ncbi:fatty acid hydroxylase superfamily protein, partial [Metarhizium majus ARSEF 297]